MSNETPAPEGVKNRPVGAHDEQISDEKVRPVVVDNSGSDVREQPMPLVEPARGTSQVSERSPDVVVENNGDAPVSAPTEPIARTEQEPPPRAATSAASMQTVYVPAPVAPLKKGNRGFGVLIALLSSVVFAGFYALAIAAVQAVEIGVFRFDFFGSLDFYTPIAFFFVGFVIVVLLANRASWWSFVVGSLFVALFVYFASVGAGLLANNVFGLTPTNAARLFSAALLNPFIIAAALIARETSMWMGALISARGRKVKARNIEARETFDRESTARAAEYENSRYGVRDATV